VTDFLDEKRREITARLDELRPLLDEYARLQAAAIALDGMAASTPKAVLPRKRGAGRPRRQAADQTSTNNAATAGKPAQKSASVRSGGRKKGGGKRAAEALALIAKRPGISIPELAAKISVSPNYLYSVIRGLQQEGKVEKQGRGWLPKQPAAA
jgi:hypothetical protein